MKNLILSPAVLLTMAINASAANAFPENEKVVKTFKQLFKDADNISWSETNHYYEAFFTRDAIKTRATFDSRGSLIQTIRYYKEENLPANVLYEVKRSYPAKEVWGVTEVTNKNGVNYRIVLKDDKSYTHINANSYGETETVARYKRGDK